MEKSEKTCDTVTKISEGSTPAAAKVITVDVDPDALSCPRCLHPLVPPVLQCSAGHLVCSACHDDLPDKTKCASCFVSTDYTRYSIPTSYNRCHGVERILRSVRVTCRNAIHGCTEAKMLYHEKTEHEKTCPSKAGLKQQKSSAAAERSSRRRPGRAVQRPLFRSPFASSMRTYLWPVRGKRKASRSSCQDYLDVPATKKKKTA